MSIALGMNVFHFGQEGIEIGEYTFVIRCVAHD